MKNNLIHFGSMISLLLAVNGTLSADEAVELENVQAKVSGIFPDLEAQHIFASPIDGWYTIRKGVIVAYISSNGRYLIQGDIIDLEDRLNLTEISRNEARRELLAAYPKEQMIVFEPENPRYSVSVFTDIDCTYCRRLHSKIDEYLAAGIEVRYLLYPRNGPDSQAWTKSEEVWCADDRNEALTLAKLDKPFETHSCEPDEVSTQYALGQDIGLSGTPALVLEDGTLISGYLTPEQLTRTLTAAAE